MKDRTEARRSEPRRRERERVAGRRPGPEPGGGGGADRPPEIPSRGWRDILMRTKQQIGEDNIAIVAAGVAFFAFLAIFPAITATLSIYGLVVDPITVEQQFSQLAGVMPEEARNLLSQQFESVAAASSGALGWGLALSILVALWAANTGTKALFKALNIAYDENETRGFFGLHARTLAATLAAIVLAILAMAMVIAVPAALGSLGLPAVAQAAIRWGRWLVLLALILFGFSTLYRYAPDRAGAKWRWVTWGSAAAAVLWILGSLAFSHYVSSFGSYDRTYGSLAAVAILMLWFYLTSFAILLGAEVNSEMEAQTRRDSTTGEAQPMSERQAYVADTLGEVPG